MGAGHSLRPRRLAVATVTLLVAFAPGTLAASAPRASRGPGARLQGRFQLAGRVTVADNVAGERPGQLVRRTWRFIPQCASGSCRRIVLRRSRRSGTDTVVLTRRSRGYYRGSGAFYAPLQCAGRTYKRGQRVLFGITVRIASAALTGGVVVATRIRASYDNRSRRNLTTCVAVLGRDAAVYTGRLA